MVDVLNDQTVDEETETQNTGKRERSRIAFPYSDLGEALATAQAIWEHVGAGQCEYPQLAAWLKHDSVNSGAFRQKVAGAKTFGIASTSQGHIRLTALGRRIVDPQQADAAKVEAFLTVPLYLAIYDRYKGTVLPNIVGLDREMAELGVAQKQVSKARQAFQRSAQEAGFFGEGNNKLVRPGSVGTERQDVPAEKEMNGGGDEPPPTEMHPFVMGLVETLPAPGAEWSDEDRDEWTDAAKAVFKLIYKMPKKLIPASTSAPEQPPERSPDDAQH